MVFKRKPLYANETDKSVDKFMKRMKKYLKKNKADFKENTSGGIEFITDSAVCGDYLVTVYGDGNMFWFSGSIKFSEGPTEQEFVKILNECSAAKSPVDIHLEYNYSTLFFNMCFTADVIGRKVEPVIMTWWKYLDISLEDVVKKTGIVFKN